MRDRHSRLRAGPVPHVASWPGFDTGVSPSKRRAPPTSSWTSRRGGAESVERTGLVGVSCRRPYWFRNACSGTKTRGERFTLGLLPVVPVDARGRREGVPAPSPPAATAPSTEDGVAQGCEGVCLRRLTLDQADRIYSPQSTCFMGMVC